MTRSQVTLGPMRPDELLDAIERPAKLVGLPIETELLKTLAEAVRQPVSLPLLEYALFKTCEKDSTRLSYSNYLEIGGIGGSIASSADKVYATLAPDQKEAAKRLFLRLVRVADLGEDGADTRNCVRKAELDELCWTVALRFAHEKVRLLTVAGPTDPGGSQEGNQTVEVAHEALIRNWSQLKEWIKPNREFLNWRQRLDGVRREWESAGGDPSCLYSGTRLAVAEEWASSHPGELSKAETEFIRCSRELREREIKKRTQVAQKLQRFACVSVGAAVVALILLVVSVFLLRNSVWARRAAQEQAHLAQIAAEAAQHALTDSFFRIIGVLNQDVLPRDEREALWELAQLNRANAVVRDNLLKRWFETSEALTRGEARGGQGFRAVTGLNLEYHRLAISGAEELGRRLAAALDNPQETNSDRLFSLGSALAALAAKMEPQAVAEIAKGLATALENPQETNYFRLSSLGSALAALTDKMEPQAAAEIAKRLAAALGNEFRPSFQPWHCSGGIDG
jgi:hypothetical protein